MIPIRPWGGALLILVLAVAVASAVAAIMWLPPIIVSADIPSPAPPGAVALTEAERLGAISAVRQHMLWAAGGLIAIITLIFTWRRDQIARFGARLDRDANFTTRYTEAIAQLGSEEPSIRLGGIYALERIATDSPRDHPTILEVLAAYVREGSPAGTTPQVKLRQDLAAAVTVIGRLSQLHSSTWPVNLSSTYLGYAELAGANLEGANLNDSVLLYATMTGANLRGARLSKANLSDVNLTDANLEGAELYGVLAQDAYFDYAILEDARLDGARLIGTQLRGAKLKGAVLAEAEMTDANLVGADLTGADLSKANLLQVARPGVDFSGADLSEAINGPSEI